MAWGAVIITQGCHVSHNGSGAAPSVATVQGGKFDKTSVHPAQLDLGVQASKKFRWRGARSRGRGIVATGWPSPANPNLISRAVKMNGVAFLTMRATASMLPVTIPYVAPASPRGYHPRPGDVRGCHGQHANGRCYPPERNEGRPTFIILCPFPEAGTSWLSAWGPARSGSPSPRSGSRPPGNAPSPPYPSGHH